jgi:hypothetical protein
MSTFLVFIHGRIAGKRVAVGKLIVDLTTYRRLARQFAFQGPVLCQAIRPPCGDRA